jgi:1,4-dihydroxy-2-naphthoate octaprenyltransferase
MRHAISYRAILATTGRFCVIYSKFGIFGLWGWLFLAKNPIFVKVAQVTRKKRFFQ